MDDMLDLLFVWAWERMPFLVPIPRQRLASTDILVESLSTTVSARIATMDDFLEPYSIPILNFSSSESATPITRINCRSSIRQNKIKETYYPLLTFIILHVWVMLNLIRSYMFKLNIQLNPWILHLSSLVNMKHPLNTCFVNDRHNLKLYQAAKYDNQTPSPYYSFANVLVYGTTNENVLSQAKLTPSYAEDSLCKFRVAKPSNQRLPRVQHA
ncbi:hypothetical protein AHAS_Ahas08G0108300 [Arachis hypogaea]